MPKHTSDIPARICFCAPNALRVRKQPSIPGNAWTYYEHTQTYLQHTRKNSFFCGSNALNHAGDLPRATGHLRAAVAKRRGRLPAAPIFATGVRRSRIHLMQAEVASAVHPATLIGIPVGPVRSSCAPSSDN
jgi:hypothetical protein